MITATGWTWDQAETQLNFPRYLELHRYWRAAPPVHVLLAGFVGYKGAPQQQTSAVRELAGTDDNEKQDAEEQAFAAFIGELIST